MADFILAVGEGLTGFLGFLATVTTALLGNAIFQLVFAFVVASIMIGLLVGLVKGLRGRKKRR